MYSYSKNKRSNNRKLKYKRIMNERAALASLFLYWNTNWIRVYNTGTGGSKAVVSDNKFEGRGAERQNLIKVNE